MSEGERQKNKRLLKEFKQLALRKKGEELLAVLPQGEGSSLNADMVDGMHAEQIIAETLERIGFPKKGRPTFGGGGMEVHGNSLHSPNFLPQDGSGAMTGNLNLGGNKLVGDSVSGGDLILESTSHATKGDIISDSHLVGGDVSGGVSAYYLGSAANYWKRVYGSSVIFITITGGATTSGINTRNAANAKILFKARLVEVGSIEDNGGVPFWSISRAGDITSLATKTLTFPNIIVNSINGVDYTPPSDEDVDLITVNVTGTPKLWWDEATDAFEMNKDLTLPGGSLNLGTAILTDRNGCGACHAFTAIGEGGVAGYLRLAHGTAPTNNEADFLQLYSQVDELYIRTSVGVVETIHTSKKPAILDVDSAEAFLVRKAGDAGDVLIVDTINGRIGINKTPDEWLHIFGNNAAIKLEDDSGNYARIKVGNSQLTFEADPENVFSSTDIVFRLDGFEVARFALYGNFGLKTTQFGGGRGIFAIGNASIIPSGEIDDAGIIYVEAGALKYRGSTGTVTLLAPA